jgi:hypothetical protein
VSVGEICKVMTQVDHDLTPVNRFDRPLGLIKNLGRHKDALAVGWVAIGWEPRDYVGDT